MLSLLRGRSPVVFGLLALITSAATTPASGDAPRNVRDWEALWTKVLVRHVDEEGRIDFAALARGRGDLDRVVAFIAATDPATHPATSAAREARLGYYINAYNALAM